MLTYERWGTMVALGLALAAARPASAQTALFTDLVQMPVAVTRAELAGVPVAELRVVVPALNAGGLVPSDFIDTVRFLPLLLDDDFDFDDDFDDDFDGFLRERIDRGVRGRELAALIHDRLRQRGIPAGPKLHRRHPLDRDFIVFDVDDIPGRDRPGRARGQEKDRDDRPGRARGQEKDRDDHPGRARDGKDGGAGPPDGAVRDHERDRDGSRDRGGPPERRIDR